MWGRDNFQDSMIFLAEKLQNKIPLKLILGLKIDHEQVYLNQIIISVG